MRSNENSLAPGTAVIALFRSCEYRGPWPADEAYRDQCAKRIPVGTKIPRTLVRGFLFAALLLCVFDAACGYDENYSHMSARAYVKALQRSRSHMYDASTNFDEAFTFGTLVHELILRGKAGAVPYLDKDLLVDESIGYLDETAVKTKKADNLSALYVLKYEILLDSGDNRAAVKALKAALEAYPGGPALRPLLQILIKTGHKANVPVWCKYERSRLVSNDDLYLLCVICAQHGDRLEWLSTADRRTLGYRVSVSNRKKDTADTAADTAGAKY